MLNETTTSEDSDQFYGDEQQYDGYAAHRR